MWRFAPSLKYATAVAVAALSLQAAARTMPDAALIHAGAPAIQHPRGDAASGFVLAVSPGKTTRHVRMRRCLQSWDPGTQMSKSEWKRSCQRMIIRQPGMFGPDPL
jgi:hypothetical protein